MARRYRPGPKKQYGDQLKDPRWQRKRLRVLERDEWTCQACLGRDQTLNVHHLWYEGAPWEVPDEALVTLCDDCHTTEPLYRSEQEGRLLRALQRAFPTSGWVEDLADALDVAGPRAARCWDTIICTLKNPEIERAASALVNYWHDTDGESPRIPDVYRDSKDEQYAWIANACDGEAIPLASSPQEAYRLMTLMASLPPDTRSAGGTGPYHSA